MVSLLSFLQQKQKQQQQSLAKKDGGLCEIESGEERDLKSEDFLEYGTVQDESVRKIRFQVVVWYVGPVDVVLGKVEMKFRVTIYWNTPSHLAPTDHVGYGLDNPWHKKVWTMHGRQRAFERNLSSIMDQDSRLVYVPPVSILNAVDLETVGDPEVCLIDETAQLMKWTCLYKASLLQDNIQVSNFPHDGHDLVLRLGVLKHRQAHKRWDRNRWKLALATAEDTLDTIHTPHGLIVDHVKVPGFSYMGGLEFEFVPLHYGIQEEGYAQDQCLQVKLRVNRDASYYNCNIIPLLAMLNFVAVSTLTLDASSFGARGEMILATSFVEIGIRMTVDSRLPLVGYQIKIQVVLNNFFYGLIFLGLESSLVYVVNQQYGIDTTLIDRAAVILELVHLLIALAYYYCWF
jgi:hypothetical protein